MTQRIQELMTRDVRHIPESATLADAAKVMQEKNCGIVPVIDSGGRKLAGVLTDRDLARAANGGSADKELVQDVGRTLGSISEPKRT